MLTDEMHGGCCATAMRDAALRCVKGNEQGRPLVRTGFGGRTMTDLSPSQVMGVDIAAGETTATKTRAVARKLPDAQGLYDPKNEHDACGVGFVAHMKGVKSHQIVKDGLFMLENLTHRGAVGADPLMGDGAGILVQIPDRFFREEMAKQGITLPKAGEYAVGHIFMPREGDQIEHFKKVIGEVIAEEGQVLLGFRDVPVDNSSLSKAPDIAATEPHHVQVFIGMGAGVASAVEFERSLFLLRKVISNRIYNEGGGQENRDFYPVSLSASTIVYKGMFLAYQVGAYYKDLVDPRFESAVALVHQRFSTNTFPRGSWRTRIAWLPITAKSTRCVATSTGWRPDRLPSRRRSSARTFPSSGRFPMKASRTRPASTTRSSSSCAAAIPWRMP